MKMVLVADLHLDAWLLGAPRFDEVHRALRRSVEVAHDEKVDVWAVVGDVANPESGPVILRVLDALMGAVVDVVKTGARAVLIPGNHCVVEDGSGATMMTPFRALADLHGIGTGMQSIFVAERPEANVCSDQRGRTSIHALPFTPGSHPYDPEEFVRSVPDHGGTHVFLSHLFVEGIEPGSEETEMARGRRVFLPRKVIGERFGDRAVIFNGHHHERQVFEPPDGSPPVHVIGAPAAFAFGEESNEPGFLLVEV
jgi:DNA repair exonuclease SbcCD nuclease subunit